MTVRSFRNLACLAVVTAFLVSCSSTHRLYMESLRLAFRSGPEKSLADIQQSKIDLMQIELGDRNPAFLALAYLENDQHKWVSADHAVFVFHHDKLVQTSGFATDVLSTSHLDTNPLVDIASANTTTWQYTIDIANHEYGLPVESTFKKDGTVTKSFYGQTFTLDKWVETVRTEPSTPYWDSAYDWENSYLVEPVSGNVFYSEQTASPFTETMVITYVSRIARHIKNSGGL
ncbi:MAG TPA: hypothetical protein DEH24_01400 [Alteromonas sp.]|nr:hypothetical protein [Alteromonadaceae bacterium]HBY38039.1 hypothetical protein [Alteromonas sp.]